MIPTTLHASFSIPTHYDVHLTREVFSLENPLLQEILSKTGPHPQIFCILDQGVADAFSRLPEQITAWASHFHLPLRPPLILPGGEALKNDYRKLMEVMDQMMETHLCRHSLVLAIGGGALLDGVGLAASLLHRGIRILRMPTTTLAQNDAGIGVKNGMNLHGVKNAIGTFAPPLAVVNDLSLLDGLSPEAWRDGISEAFKVALIKDDAFFSELCTMSEKLGQRDAASMERLITRCAALHLQHISTSGDPFETGSSRPLDFGHWAAHKLETLSHYRLSHGQAVAVGITLDTAVAEHLGFVKPETTLQLKRALTTCGFDLNPPELRQRLGDGSLHLLQGLDEFREHLGGELTLSMPSPAGKMTEMHEMKPEWVEQAVSSLAEIPCV